MFKALFAIVNKIKGTPAPPISNQSFPHLELPEESFLITEPFNEIRVVKTCDDYMLPAEYEGYRVQQEYDESLPRIIVTHSEAQHFADCIALIKQDDPEYTVEKAIRFFLVTHPTLHYGKLHMSKDEFNKLNEQQLIECLQRISMKDGVSTYDGCQQIPELVRNVRNKMARQYVGNKICGYLILTKNKVDYLLCVSNPELTSRGSLEGPLPALLNTESRSTCGEYYNGPPGYTLHCCYGHVTYLTDITLDHNIWNW